MRRPDAPRRGRRRRSCRRICVRACKLDQGGCTGGVVVRAGAAGAVVSMGNDDDRRRRAPRHDRHEVLERQPAAAGDLRREPVGPDDESVRPQLVGEPRRGARRARRIGRAFRVRSREIECQLPRALRVERRRQVRSRQRRRACDGERGEQQREGDEQPGAAVRPPADRPFERAAPRATPSARGRGGGHAWL